MCHGPPDVSSWSLFESPDYPPGKRAGPSFEWTPTGGIVHRRPLSFGNYADDHWVLQSCQPGNYALLRFDLRRAQALAGLALIFAGLCLVVCSLAVVFAAGAPERATVSGRAPMQTIGANKQQTMAAIWSLAQFGSRTVTQREFSTEENPVNGLTLISEGSDKAARMRRLPLRVLNMRRLAQIARAHMLASIPSINPAGKAAVVGCYCYRSSPTAEFHAGVDLDANYGDVVRASAAGTVVAADYDGGYGLKVDIDHGNGYHTWYAHLSRADVHLGERVTKAQPIALVGSSGRSTGPHLHYQVMRNGQAIDPEPFLRGIPPQVLAALP